MIIHKVGNEEVFETEIELPIKTLIEYSNTLKKENVGQYTGENKRSNRKGFQSFEYFYRLYQKHPINEFQTIFEKIHELILNVFDDRFNYTLNNYWVNINSPGSKNELHNHIRPYSNTQGVSGTFYIHVPTNSGNITFITQDSELEITSSVNRLILFPSYLDHKVSENLSNDDRYSIAFNYDMEIKQGKKTIF